MTPGSYSVVGRGRSADILAWGEGRVLKLYLADSSRNYVRREAEVSRLVARAGLPAPAVFDSQAPDGLHEVDGRLGILFERVDGPTMLRDLAARPWRLVAHSRNLARLHARIHSASGDGLPILHDRIEWSIARALPLVGDGVSAAARERLERLPEARSVCHGDFHPDNVILGSEGPIVIDWGPAAAGHPLADVAWTVLLFRFAGTPPGTPLPVRLLTAFVRRSALRIYLREYFRITGATPRELGDWIGVVALLRLSDDIPKERQALLRVIAKEFVAGTP